MNAKGKQGTDTPKNVLITRFIVPFYFDPKIKRFDEAETSSEGKWKLSPKNDQESDLYRFINNCFIEKESSEADSDPLPDNSSALAAMYDYYLEKNKLPTFKYTKEDGSQTNISPEKIGLILFKTGVGFWWIEIRLNDRDLFIDFNNEFKELARINRIGTEITRTIEDNTRVPENAFYHNDKIYKYVDNTYRGVMVREQLDLLGCTYEFVSSRKTDHGDLPDKALLFNYAIFNSSENFERESYRLTRGYSNNYKISDSLKIDILKPFDNVIMCATSEGCGYYGVKQSEHDVVVEYPKIAKDYFRLYILALYPSFSLLSFSDRIARKLTLSPEEYGRYSSAIYNESRELNTEIMYLSKSIYSSVSFVQHQNDFYDFVIKKLKIREGIKSISTGIDALRDLQRNLENEKSEKRGRILNIILAIISIVGILQSVSAVFDIIDFFK